MKSCSGARIYGVEGCQRRHHPLLHSSEVIPPNNNIPGVPEVPTPKTANDNDTNPIQDIGPNGSYRCNKFINSRKKLDWVKYGQRTVCRPQQRAFRRMLTCKNGHILRALILLIWWIRNSQFSLAVTLLKPFAHLKYG